MIKKILSLVIALSMYQSVYAYDVGEMSAEYEYFETVSGYAAEMFIDETITKEDFIYYN